MLWQCSQQEGEKVVAYFDHINNLCAQAKDFTNAETVVEVVQKNLVPSY